MYHMMNYETQNNIDNECPICLEEIEIDSGLIIMECCNKKLHLTCLINWYISNPTKQNCFICNQSNKFCNDLVRFGINQENNTQREYVVEIINPQNNIVVGNNNQTRIPIYLNKFRLFIKIGILCIIGIIFLVILIVYV